MKQTTALAASCLHPGVVARCSGQSDLATRNPISPILRSALSAARLAERSESGAWNHAPPRTMRKSQSPDSQAEPSTGAPHSSRFRSPASIARHFRARRRGRSGWAETRRQATYTPAVLARRECAAARIRAEVRVITAERLSPRARRCRSGARRIFPFGLEGNR